VTTGLQNLLYVASKTLPELLIEHLDLIFTSVHALLAAAIKAEPPNTKVPEKNHQELIKIFEYMGGPYMDQVMTFLQKHVESKEPLLRVVTVRIFRHLASTLPTQLSPYRDTLVSGLCLMSNEVDYFMHGEIVKLIDEIA
jgi:hypothetical protein